LGELLARNPPDQAGSQQGAKIAAACYVKLYKSRWEPERNANRWAERLVAIADHMLDTWPDLPLVDDTLKSLVVVMMREDRVEDVVVYLAEISETSRHYVPAALQAGEWFWSKYLTGKRRLAAWRRDGNMPPDVDEEMEQERLNRLRNLAQRFLTLAIERERVGGAANRQLPTAVLAFVQLHLEFGTSRKALDLLEDPRVGPLAFVRTKHRAAQFPEYARETYKAAIRAHEAVGNDGKAAHYRGLLGKLLGEAEALAVLQQHRVPVVRNEHGNAEEVRLYGIIVCSTSLEALTRLPSLKRLRISFAYVEDSLMAILAGVSTLEELDLFYADTAPGSLRHVMHLPKLKSLRCPATADDNDFVYIGRMDSLDELSLSRCSLSTARIAHLKDLRKLRVLDVSRDGARGSEVTDASFRYIAQMSNLEVLWLNCAAVSDTGLSELRSLKKLRELSLVGTNVTDAGVRGLSSLTDVRTLFLPAGFTDEGMAYLKSFRDLEELDLRNTSVGDAGLMYVKDLPRLRVLSAGPATGDAGLAHFERGSSLYELDLGGTQISDAGLSHLSRIKDLRRLSLFETNVTDDGLEHLENLSQLRWLNLYDTSTTSRAVDRLQQKIPGLEIRQRHRETTE
jgi:Leucine-rich repeat (LRR) protein